MQIFINVLRVSSQYHRPFTQRECAQWVMVPMTLTFASFTFCLLYGVTILLDCFYTPFVLVSISKPNEKKNIQLLPM